MSKHVQIVEKIGKRYRNIPGFSSGKTRKEKSLQKNIENLLKSPAESVIMLMVKITKVFADENLRGGQIHVQQDFSKCYRPDERSDGSRDWGRGFE